MRSVVVVKVFTGKPEHGDRPDVDDVLIIITDGAPTIDVDETIPVSNYLLKYIHYKSNAFYFM